MKRRKSTGLLLSFYGDDFTGSTDVLDSLARAGLRTVLFLAPPTLRQLSRFPGLHAFGVAGEARTLSPARMQRELRPAFQALKASGAPIVHYKTCSTFDSSPKIGSIGKAIEIGRVVFGNRLTPLVVGAPVLGRFVVFGNLFARSGLDSEPARLDRHPTMSRHPVTPMDEADLRLHLARQTDLPIELVDVHKLEAALPKNNRPRPGRNGWQVPDPRKADSVEAFLSALGARRPAPIVLFDTLGEAHLRVIGRAIAHQAAGRTPLFCAGSSGIEQALVTHWADAGRLSPPAAAVEPANSPAKQWIVISGSCSPVTDRQIDHALSGGFVEIACDICKLAEPRKRPAAVADALARGWRALEAGRPVIFQTARGPEDARRPAFERLTRARRGATREARLADAGRQLALGLAGILERALEQTGRRRAVICGGDTASAVARALGIEALEYVSPAAPGAPVCRVHAPGRTADGCDMVFKGGQVGRDSFFEDLTRAGGI